MNNAILRTTMAIAMAASTLASAGRDGAQISQQEKANRLVAEQRELDVLKTGKLTQQIALPLDHGPRAQVSPWVNQQRLQRAEAMATRATPNDTMEARVR